MQVRNYSRKISIPAIEIIEVLQNSFTKTNWTLTSELKDSHISLLDQIFGVDKSQPQLPAPQEQLQLPPSESESSEIQTTIPTGDLAEHLQAHSTNLTTTDVETLQANIQTSIIEERAELAAIRDFQTYQGTYADTTRTLVVNDIYQKLDARNLERVKEQNENSVGAKAKRIADEAIASLGNVSQVSAKVVETTAQAGKTLGDIAPTIKPNGYQNGFQSSSLSHKSDVYGGIAFPVQDFSGMIPSDLLSPQIELQASDEQLTNGLATYAGASRAQELLQAGFKYIQEVGQTRQQYHKAEQSIIRGATEGVKVQQEVVNFDIANVNLATNQEKLIQADEKLIQARVTSQAYRNETEQMRMFYEAKEQKKNAEIQRLQAESQKIIQTYLKGRVPV